MGYFVYCHTNKVNGKKYIGITGTNPKRRWMNGIGYKSSRHFNFAIEKYGWDNFEHEILYSGLTKDEACDIEKRLIAEFRTNESEYGYNISSGGQSGAAGVKQSFETIEKRADKHRGRKHSEETKRKMSEAAKGRTFSPETIEKMRKAATGRKMSDEAKAKMSKVRKGRKMPEEAKKKISDSKPKRKVYCYETDTIYESVNEAGRKLGVPASNISAVCRKKHEHTKGYHFEYFG